jgi:stage II sporulation protein GA (sporulation sigma-E factor processing peptidase)
MYVYIEYLLLENMIINFIILYVTGILTRTKTSRNRLFIASLLGSLYIFYLFFPNTEFMGEFIVKFAISILMIVVAFNPEKFNLFLKQISAFYLISFIFAGTTIGLYYILNSNLILSNVSFRTSEELIKFLIIGIGLSTILIRYIFKHYRVKMNKENFLTRITINLNNRKVNLMALIDTGNSLKEPITQKPVIIAEYKAIEPILPEKLKKLYAENKEIDLNLVGKIMEEIGNEVKLRLIPYKSIGNENGMLIGFKPDSVKIYLNDEIKKIKDDIIVAIYNNKLSNDEQYNGLLHPEILV